MTKPLMHILFLVMLSILIHVHSLDRLGFEIYTTDVQIVNCSFKTYSCFRDTSTIDDILIVVKNDLNNVCSFDFKVKIENFDHRLIIIS